MRREIIGIVLFFLVIFTLTSLLSYSPEDPSIHTARSAGEIHNVFGWLGAHVSGILIGLFGAGAFWVPVLFLLAIAHVYFHQRERALVYIAIGGLLLMVTTGSLLDRLSILGNRFASGGIIGIPIKSILTKYTSSVGGTLILLVTFLIGFILATGFSLVAFFQKIVRAGVTAKETAKTLLMKWREQWLKSRRHVHIQKQRELRKEDKIKIVAPVAKPVKRVPAPKQKV